MAETVATAPFTPPAAPSAAPPASASPPSPQRAPPPAARPGSISAADYHRLEPAEQSKWANLPGGQWIERAKLESEQADPTKPATADGKAAVTADGKLRVGDFELSAEDVSTLMQQKATNDLRATQVPADPNGYRIELPKDFVLPAGLDFKFNEADPALAAARAWSHSVGLSQEQFTGLLSQYASMKATEEATFRNAMKAELDKLGANATARVTAIETFYRGIVGDDLAKSVRASLFSAKVVEAWELVAKRMASQGAASFSQAHREPGGQTGRVSEEQWAGMSPRERWDYARGFDQSQFKNGGR
jgi:hypothetical protein